MDNEFLLAPGYSISRVIKGGWQVSMGHTPGANVDRERSIQDTLAFIREGITTLDFGDIYLGVEEMVGESLRRLKDERGSETCDMVRLHTKYVPDINALSTHRFADAERIIHRSLNRLGVERLDLVQFHWWNYAVPGYVEALQCLAKLQSQGYIRLLGVTNFDMPRMKEFVDAGVTPATIQLQYSVLDRRPENDMIDFCREHGISLLCYGTVAGGFLSERYLGMPEPSHPFENRSLVKYKLIIDEFGGWEKFQELLGVLKSISQKHACDLSSVASAYILGKPQVAGVIVGARNRSHLAENLRIMDLQLDSKDIAAIDAVLASAPGPKGDVYGLERDDPKHSGIMHKQNNSK
jgi:aryl-alcohol dehydrogenase-like predicted oxidoreductase